MVAPTSRQTALSFSPHASRLASRQPKPDVGGILPVINVIRDLIRLMALNVTVQIYVSFATCLRAILMFTIQPCRKHICRSSRLILLCVVPSYASRLFTVPNHPGKHPEKDLLHLGDKYHLPSWSAPSHRIAHLTIHLRMVFARRVGVQGLDQLGKSSPLPLPRRPRLVLHR